MAFILGACSTSVVSAEQIHPLKIWAQNENGQCETYCVIDENTGVNYVVVVRDTTSRGDGIAITPRLNADGSLYVEY